LLKSWRWNKPEL